MDFWLNHLQQASEIDNSTLTLICVMCGVAMYFIRNHLVIPGLIVVLYPLLVTLSVAANYALTRLEMFPLNKYDQWLICTITSASIGTVLGLVISSGLATLLEHMVTNRKPVSRA